MNTKTSVLLIVLALFGFVSVAPVHAFDLRKSDDVTVAKNEIVKGSLVAGGNSITVDGTIEGDLYCGTQTLLVRGRVVGDVICAGQTMQIAGVVDGNIRAAGQLIDIAGSVKRNMTVIGQTITVERGAVVGGEVFAAGQTVMLAGPVGPGAVVAGQTVRLDEAVSGDVTAFAQTVSLGEKAKIGGAFTYTSPSEFTQATGAAVVGKVTHLLPKKENIKSKEPKMNFRPWPASKPWPQNAIGPMLFFMVIGALVALLRPEKLRAVSAQMLARPWLDVGLGFLIVMGVPILIILVAITIIGIPVALLMGLAFTLAVFASRIYVGAVVGAKLFEAVTKDKVSLLAQVLVGIAISVALFHTPIVGGFFGFLALLWGLGGVVATFGKSNKTK